MSNLLEEWGPYIDKDTKLSKVKREHLALILENQNLANKQYVSSGQQTLTEILSEAAPTNSMGASSSVAGAGNVDIYDPVLIDMVKRSFPNLMAYDVCGVQPMSGPTGLIFALRSRYGSQTGTEALYDEANTSFGASYSGNTTMANNQVGVDPTLLITTGSGAYTFAGGMSTAQAEALGGAAGDQFNEMAFSIEKVSVTAKSRALKAEYSHEIAQDLMNVHNLSAETELTSILSAELLAEINREVVRSIYATATIGAQTNVTNAGRFDLDVDSNGRWQLERFQSLIFQIEKEANAIARATRRGKGNFIITTSDVASALNMAGKLQAPAKEDVLDVDDTGNTFAGYLNGRTKVFIDPYAENTTGNNVLVVGYKGQSQYDAGLFYAPYVPLQMYKTVGENSFQPKIGFKSRYGMVAHPFATSAADGAIDVTKKNLYYRGFVIQNLG